MSRKKKWKWTTRPRDLKGWKSTKDDYTTQTTKKNEKKKFLKENREKDRSTSLTTKKV